MALYNHSGIKIEHSVPQLIELDIFNAVQYVSDDDFKIVYNVNGKEETIKLEELESSTLFSNGAPKSGNYAK